LKLNKIFSFFSSSCTALTALHFKHKVQQVRDDVSYQRFKRLFSFLPRF